MLGRNAAGIYWMFRYLERCENNARLLRAGLRISMTQYDHASQDWESVLMATSIKTLFDKIYNECNSSSVINFILREKELSLNFLSISFTCKTPIIFSTLPENTGCLVYELSLTCLRIEE